MSDIILSNVLFLVIVVALFAIMDKLSGVNYRTHINPKEMTRCACTLDAPCDLCENP